MVPVLTVKVSAFSPLVLSCPRRGLVSSVFVRFGAAACGFRTRL